MIATKRVNKFDISGEIAAITEERGYPLLIIKQLVGGVMPTEFTVLLKFPCSYNMGDVILITNALLYQKDGCFRLKVEKDEQVLKLKSAVNLGTINAEDKFI